MRSTLQRLAGVPSAILPTSALANSTSDVGPALPQTQPARSFGATSASASASAFASHNNASTVTAGPAFISRPAALAALPTTTSAAFTASSTSLAGSVLLVPQRGAAYGAGKDRRGGSGGRVSDKVPPRGHTQPLTPRARFDVNAHSKRQQQQQQGEKQPQPQSGARSVDVDAAEADAAQFDAVVANAVPLDARRTNSNIKSRKGRSDGNDSDADVDVAYMQPAAVPPLAVALATLFRALSAPSLPPVSARAKSERDIFDALEHARVARSQGLLGKARSLVMNALDAATAAQTRFIDGLGRAAANEEHARTRALQSWRESFDAALEQLARAELPGAAETASAFPRAPPMPPAAPQRAVTAAATAKLARAWGVTLPTPQLWAAADTCIADGAPQDVNAAVRYLRLQARAHALALAAASPPAPAELEEYAAAAREYNDAVARYEALRLARGAPHQGAHPPRLMPESALATSSASISSADGETPLDSPEAVAVRASADLTSAGLVYLTAAAARRGALDVAVTLLDELFPPPAVPHRSLLTYVAQHAARALDYGAAAALLRVLEARGETAPPQWPAAGMADALLQRVRADVLAAERARARSAQRAAAAVTHAQSAAARAEEEADAHAKKAAAKAAQGAGSDDKSQSSSNGSGKKSKKAAAAAAAEAAEAAEAVEGHAWGVVLAEASAPTAPAQSFRAAVESVSAHLGPAARRVDPTPFVDVVAAEAGYLFPGEPAPVGVAPEAAAAAAAAAAAQRGAWGREALALLCRVETLSQAYWPQPATEVTAPALLRPGIYAPAPLPASARATNAAGRDALSRAVIWATPMLTEALYLSTLRTLVEANAPLSYAFAVLQRLVDSAAAYAALNETDPSGADPSATSHADAADEASPSSSSRALVAVRVPVVPTAEHFAAVMTLCRQHGAWDAAMALFVAMDSGMRQLLPSTPLPPTSVEDDAAKRSANLQRQQPQMPPQQLQQAVLWGEGSGAAALSQALIERHTYIVRPATFGNALLNVNSAARALAATQCATHSADSRPQLAPASASAVAFVAQPQLYSVAKSPTVLSLAIEACHHLSLPSLSYALTVALKSAVVAEKALLARRTLEADLAAAVRAVDRRLVSSHGGHHTPTRGLGSRNNNKSRGCRTDDVDADHAEDDEDVDMTPMRVVLVTDRALLAPDGVVLRPGTSTSISRGTARLLAHLDGIYRARLLVPVCTVQALPHVVSSQPAIRNHSFAIPGSASRAVAPATAAPVMGSTTFALNSPVRFLVIEAVLSQLQANWRRLRSHARTIAQLTGRLAADVNDAVTASQAVAAGTADPATVRAAATLVLVPGPAGGPARVAVAAVNADTLLDALRIDNHIFDNRGVRPSLRSPNSPPVASAYVDAEDDSSLPSIGLNTADADNSISDDADTDAARAVNAFAEPRAAAARIAAARSIAQRRSGRGNVHTIDTEAVLIEEASADAEADRAAATAHSAAESPDASASAADPFAGTLAAEGSADAYAAADSAARSGDSPCMPSMAQWLAQAAASEASARAQQRPPTMGAEDLSAAVTAALSAGGRSSRAPQANAHHGGTRHAGSGTWVDARGRTRRAPRALWTQQSMLNTLLRDAVVSRAQRARALDEDASTVEELALDAQLATALRFAVATWGVRRGLEASVVTAFVMFRALLANFNAAFAATAGLAPQDTLAQRLPLQPRVYYAGRRGALLAHVGPQFVLSVAPVTLAAVRAAVSLSDFALVHHALTKLDSFLVSHPELSNNAIFANPRAAAVPPSELAAAAATARIDRSFITVDAGGARSVRGAQSTTLSPMPPAAARFKALWISAAPTSAVATDANVIPSANPRLPAYPSLLSAVGFAPFPSMQRVTQMPQAVPMPSAAAAAVTASTAAAAGSALMLPSRPWRDLSVPLAPWERPTSAVLEALWTLRREAYVEAIAGCAGERVNSDADAGSLAVLYFTEMRVNAMLYAQRVDHTHQVRTFNFLNKNTVDNPRLLTSGLNMYSRAAVGAGPSADAQSGLSNGSGSGNNARPALLGLMADRSRGADQALERVAEGRAREERRLGMVPVAGAGIASGDKWRADIERRVRDVLGQTPAVAADAGATNAAAGSDAGAGAGRSALTTTDSGGASKASKLNRANPFDTPSHIDLSHVDGMRPDVAVITALLHALARSAPVGVLAAVPLGDATAQADVAAAAAMRRASMASLAARVWRDTLELALTPAHTASVLTGAALTSDPRAPAGFPGLGLPAPRPTAKQLAAAMAVVTASLTPSQSALAAFIDRCVASGLVTDGGLLCEQPSAAAAAPRLVGEQEMLRAAEAVDAAAAAAKKPMVSANDAADSNATVNSMPLVFANTLTIPQLSRAPEDAALDPYSCLVRSPLFTAVPREHATNTSDESAGTLALPFTFHLQDELFTAGALQQLEFATILTSQYAGAVTPVPDAATNGYSLAWLDDGSAAAGRSKSVGDALRSRAAVSAAITTAGAMMLNATRGYTPGSHSQDSTLGAISAVMDGLATRMLAGTYAAGLCTPDADGVPLLAGVQPPLPDLRAVSSWHALSPGPLAPIPPGMPHPLPAAPGLDAPVHPQARFFAAWLSAPQRPALLPQVATFSAAIAALNKASLTLNTQSDNANSKSTPIPASSQPKGGSALARQALAAFVGMQGAPFGYLPSLRAVGAAVQSAALTGDMPMAFRLWLTYIHGAFTCFLSARPRAVRSLSAATDAFLSSIAGRNSAAAAAEDAHQGGMLHVPFPSDLQVAMLFAADPSPRADSTTSTRAPPLAPELPVRASAQSASALRRDFPMTAPLPITPRLQRLTLSDLRPTLAFARAVARGRVRPGQFPTAAGRGASPTRLSVGRASVEAAVPPARVPDLSANSMMQRAVDAPMSLPTVTRNLMNVFLTHQDTASAEALALSLLRLETLFIADASRRASSLLGGLYDALFALGRCQEFATRRARIQSALGLAGTRGMHAPPQSKNSSDESISPRAAYSALLPELHRAARALDRAPGLVNDDTGGFSSGAARLASAMLRALQNEGMITSTHELTSKFIGQRDVSAGALRHFVREHKEAVIKSALEYVIASLRQRCADRFVDRSTLQRLVALHESKARGALWRAQNGSGADAAGKGKSPTAKPASTAAVAAMTADLADSEKLNTLAVAHRLRARSLLLMGVERGMFPYWTMSGVGGSVFADLPLGSVLLELHGMHRVTTTMLVRHALDDLYHTFVAGARRHGKQPNGRDAHDAASAMAAAAATAGGSALDNTLFSTPDLTLSLAVTSGGVCFNVGKGRGDRPGVLRVLVRLMLCEYTSPPLASVAPLATNLGVLHITAKDMGDWLAQRAAMAHADGSGGVPASVAASYLAWLRGDMPARDSARGKSLAHDVADPVISGTGPSAAIEKLDAIDAAGLAALVSGSTEADTQVRTGAASFENDDDDNSLDAFFGAVGSSARKSDGGAAGSPLLRHGRDGAAEMLQSLARDNFPVGTAEDEVDEGSDFDEDDGESDGHDGDYSSSNAAATVKLDVRALANRSNVDVTAAALSWGSGVGEEDELLASLKRK